MNDARKTDVTKGDGQLLLDAYNRSAEANEKGRKRLMRVAFLSRSGRTRFVPLNDLQVYTDVPGSTKLYSVYDSAVWPEWQRPISAEKARSRYFNRIPVGFMSHNGVPTAYLGTNEIRWAGKPLRAVPTGTSGARTIGTTHDLRERDLTKHSAFNPAKYPIHGIQLSIARRMYEARVENHPHFDIHGAPSVTLPKFYACARKTFGKFKLRADGPNAVETAMRKVSPEMDARVISTEGADGLLWLYDCSLNDTWPAVCGADVSGVFRATDDGMVEGHVEIDAEDYDGLDSSQTIEVDGKFYLKKETMFHNPAAYLVRQLSLFENAPHHVRLEPAVTGTLSYKPKGAALWRPAELRRDMLPADIAGHRDYATWKMIAALTTVREVDDNVFVDFDLAYNGFMPWVDLSTPGFAPVQSVYHPRAVMAKQTSGVNMDLTSFDVICEWRSYRQTRQAASLQKAPAQETSVQEETEKNEEDVTEEAEAVDTVDSVAEPMS